VIDVDERFEVNASPAAVWAVLSDPREVVGCVPGAKLLAEHEDGTYDGSLTVKFGPLGVTFQAHVALELEEADRRGHLTARGRDNQGGTRFRGMATFSVAPRTEPPGSAVAIHGGVDLTGRLASMIESGAAIVVHRMAAEFAERLAARCSGATCS
jgi:carbon monoxide dehydrogenase subunit G